jgi:hypothetical protein
MPRAMTQTALKSRQAPPTTGRVPGAYRRVFTDCWPCESSNTHRQPVEEAGRLSRRLLPSTPYAPVAGLAGVAEAQRSKQCLRCSRRLRCLHCSCKWTHAYVRFATEAAGQCNSHLLHLPLSSLPSTLAPPSSVLLRPSSPPARHQAATCLVPCYSSSATLLFTPRAQCPVVLLHVGTGVGDRAVIKYS